MNVNLALVNRALLNIGESPLTAAGKDSGNTSWLAVKAYYINTFLEALAEVQWTSAKRRRTLTPTGRPRVKNAAYRHVFDLPYDCAKPLELRDGAYFTVESELLYTDAGRADLLYITNGKRPEDLAVVCGGNSARTAGAAYFTGGDARRNKRLESGDGLLYGGKAERSPPVPSEEDFPGYREWNFEPQFLLYIENSLTAKLAARVSDRPELALTYAQKAAAVGVAAASSSIAQAAAKRKPAALWTEGLTGADYQF
jgi:hypothetical protein